MSKVRSSPERHTFQDTSQELHGFWEEIRKRDKEKIHDPEWQKDNLEYDLRSTDWLIEKCEDDVYAQNLYAALCNNEFTKNEVFPILQEKRWSCSWRHAGGIIADIKQKGDYIDWYCSGIRGKEEITEDEFNNLTEDQKIYYKQQLAYVSESVVTDEIQNDLLKLGWIVIKDAE